jgi:predicted PurR-regulated permease PerM
VLALVAAAALVAVGLPLWRPLLLAAVLAGTLSPLHERLAGAVRGRRWLSAAAVTAGVTLVLLVPTLVVAALVVRQVPVASAFISRTLAEHGLMNLIARLPAPLVPWVNEALARAQRDLGPDIANWQHLRQALAAGAVALGSASHFALMTALTLVAVFFLLRDGAALVDWAETASALPPGQVRRFLAALHDVSNAVLVAQLCSGLAQAIVATIGYAIAGVPSPVVFGVVSLAASLIPVGGVSLIGVPLAVLLGLLGHPGRAIFLAIWIVAVTGLIDNFIRPLLVRGRTNLPGGLVFFALIGGLLAFGPIGLVAGPLALALFLSVDTVRRSQTPTQRRAAQLPERSSATRAGTDTTAIPTAPSDIP